KAVLESPLNHVEGLLLIGEIGLGDIEPPLKGAQTDVVSSDFAEKRHLHRAAVVDGRLGHRTRRFDRSPDASLHIRFPGRIAADLEEAAALDGNPVRKSETGGAAARLQCRGRKVYRWPESRLGDLLNLSRLLDARFCNRQLMVCLQRAGDERVELAIVE